jgi:hypothetical protein
LPWHRRSILKCDTAKKIQFFFFFEKRLIRNTAPFISSVAEADILTLIMRPIRIGSEITQHIMGLLESPFQPSIVLNLPTSETPAFPIPVVTHF